MKNIGTTIKHILASLVIFAAIYFFYHTFQSNLEGLRQFHFKADPGLLMLSTAAIMGSYLLATYGTFIALDSMSSLTVPFLYCVAAVNSSSVVKYLPGKVWSYAVQLHWLSKAGFPRPVILYVNLINIFISLITSIVVSAGYLLFASTTTFKPLLMFVLLLTVALDCLFLKYTDRTVNVMISACNRYFKREVACMHMPLRLNLKLHAVHGVAAVCFGISAILASYGLGFDFGIGTACYVMASFILADAVGFFALFVPGGFGVREGALYFLLSSMPVGPLILVLPVVTRAVSMTSDLLIGTIALILLRTRHRDV